MDGCFFYTAGSTDALRSAVGQLLDSGFPFLTAPCPAVTHLLLPVPSLDQKGQIIGSGNLSDILSCVPNAAVIGGNLPKLPDRKVYDLLQIPDYVAENAYITAHCAVRMAMDRLPIALRGCHVLVIGWGRIGKCLAALLKGLEAHVTVAARKDADRAMLQALGYEAIPTDGLSGKGFRAIFNTVPSAVLDAPEDCLNIDLASAPGLIGQNVLWARGLPGKYAPEASGELIARTVKKIISKEYTV